MYLERLGVGFKISLNTWWVTSIVTELVGNHAAGNLRLFFLLHTYACMDVHTMWLYNMESCALLQHHIISVNLATVL